MVKTTHKSSGIKLLGRLVALPLLALGCGELDDSSVEGGEAALSGDSFANANGAARTVTVNGAAIDEDNPFFRVWERTGAPASIVTSRPRP